MGMANSMLKQAAKDLYGYLVGKGLAEDDFTVGMDDKNRQLFTYHFNEKGLEMVPDEWDGFVVTKMVTGVPQTAEA